MTSKKFLLTLSPAVPSFARLRHSLRARALQLSLVGEEEILRRRKVVHLDRL